MRGAIIIHGGTPRTQISQHNKNSKRYASKLPLILTDCSTSFITCT